MLTEKGVEELRYLLESSLVGDWRESEAALRRGVTWLAAKRPDVLRLYFEPSVWERLCRLERPQAARLMLRVLKAASIRLAGEPAIVTWDQAAFYLTTGVRRYVEQAEAWSATHPEAGPRLRRSARDDLSLPAPTFPGEA